MSTLPIIVPGTPTRTVNVPCALPPSFCFDVFLPARGIRPFCAWLSSTDPLKAEVQDVTLARPEKEARFHGAGSGGAYSLEEDEEKRADEAAGDVFRAIICRLGINKPPLWVQYDAHSALPVIAYAWKAEVAAYAAQASVIGCWRQVGNTRVADELAALVTDINSPSGWAKSPACEALRHYVEAVVGEACKAQADKAGRQEILWEPPPPHHEDANPPAWAERHEEAT